MTNILIVTKRFYPPWSDGIVSYARGFVDSVLEASKLKEDLDISVLSLTDETWFPKLHSNELRSYLKTKPIDFKWFYSNERGCKVNISRVLKKLCKNTSYQLTHIIYAGLNPLSVRSKIPLKKGSIIKHIFIYPTHKTFAAEKFTYSFLQKTGFLKSFDINFSVSSEVLGMLYGFKDAIIIPPAIDTELYKSINTEHLNSNTLVKMLTKTKTKMGDLQRVLSRDVIALYMGPLIPERFPYQSILRAISRLTKEFSTDIGLVAVGRGFEELDYLREIRCFIYRNNLDGKVFFCLKDLSDREKFCLLNRVSIFIYLFQANLTRMSVVFPPIALLESMSAGKSVVAGGLPHLETLIRNYENGILIRNVVDDKEIANGIWNAVSDVKKLSINARATIDREYSIDNVSKAYLKLLKAYEV